MTVLVVYKKSPPFLGGWGDIVIFIRDYSLSFAAQGFLSFAAHGFSPLDAQGLTSVVPPSGVLPAQGLAQPTTTPKLNTETVAKVAKY